MVLTPLKLTLSGSLFGCKHHLAAGAHCRRILRFGLGIVHVLQGLVGGEQEFGNQGKLLPEGVGVGAGAAIGAQGGELLAQGAVGVEINSVVYTFGFCLKTRLSSYPALSRMSIDTGNPLCS